MEEIEFQYENLKKQRKELFDGKYQFIDLDFYKKLSVEEQAVFIDMIDKCFTLERASDMSKCKHILLCYDEHYKEYLASVCDDIKSFKAISVTDNWANMLDYIIKSKYLSSYEIKLLYENIQK